MGRGKNIAKKELCFRHGLIRGSVGTMIIGLMMASDQ